MLIATAQCGEQLCAQDKHYTVVSSDGVPLAVQETGAADGQPIIFIHGLLGSHINWEKQWQDPALQRFRLISFDLRGHGLSGKPEQATAYTEIRRWADDVAAVIKGSGAKKPILMGWSLGGAVNSHYLAAYGDKQIAGVLYVDGVVELTPTQIPAHPQVYQDMVSADLKTHLAGERDFLRLCFHQQPDTATFERLLANAALASWQMQRAVPQMNVSLARARSVNPHIRTLLYTESGHAPFLEEPQRFNQDLAAFAKSLQ